MVYPYCPLCILKPNMLTCEGAIYTMDQQKRNHEPEKDAVSTDACNRRGSFTPRYLKKKEKPPRNRIVLFFLCAMLGIGAVGTCAYFAELSIEHKKLKQMVEMVESGYVTPEIPIESVAKEKEETFLSTGNSVTPVKPESDIQEEKQILPQFAELYKENNELYGWIKIEDTKINYPVMHSPEDPEKYLHSNFEQEYSYAGLPFLDARCSAESDNLLIYAHNLLNGTMFRSLPKYENKDYWKAHPIIEFNTLYEKQSYEVMAAFYDRVYYKAEDVFKFYQFVDAADEQEYNEAIQNFKDKQIYETGVTATYGDQLLTLVTCAYHTDNGRFVVVARKVEN